MNSPARSPGRLLVVATPIGNLGDITARALDALRSVDAICAEDTRHTRQLLQQFGIERPLIAVHEHNEDEVAERLVQRMREGESLALVSDAGTPLVSDPGFRLVRAARAAGLVVSPLPGASALIAALSVAGIASDRFCFEGFLPAKQAARRARIQELAAESRTLVLYESAHRIVESLDDLAAGFGAGRRAAVARELTKRFETVLGGTLEELRARVDADPDQQRGEFVLVIAGASEDEDARLVEGRRLYAKLVEHLPPSKAASVAAELSGVAKKALYGKGGEHGPGNGERE